jgi:putative oxygen-independent coproporphyrinogen III oxidase
MNEDQYIDCLIADVDEHLLNILSKQVNSIFLGGGTPSLFSAKALDRLLSYLSNKLHFSKNIEITLEANPGTVEQQRFKDYYAIGINRLSLGVQSFQDEKLKRLGRIHDASEATNAITSLRKAGFENFNIDIMHGLPKQSVEDAMFDLRTALSFEPNHLSWYQLTIEPNTVFYKKPPMLPNEETLQQIEQGGFGLLNDHGLVRYEISAYAKEGFQSQHNLNYWRFGDYLGIGAGAHSKLTNNKNIVTRHWQVRQPKDYMDRSKSFTANKKTLCEQEIIFEYMMNVLRLYERQSLADFEKTTNLSRNKISKQLATAKKKGFLKEENFIETTDRGKLFLNDLLEVFMAKN